MKIDLHGLIENEVSAKLPLALMEFAEGEDEILEIITGQGGTLRWVVEKLLDEEGYRWEIRGNNYGAYIIKRNGFK